MNIKEIISNLRNDTPDRQKTVKKLFQTGIIFILISVWNYGIPGFMKQMPELSVWHQYFVIAMFLSGLFLLLSAYGIKNRAEWGEQVGQFGLVLFMLALLMAPLFFYASMSSFGPEEDGPDLFMKIPFVIFSFIVILQFLLPAYFAIGYLGRLRKQDMINTGNYGEKNKWQRSVSEPDLKNYRYAPLFLNPGLLLIIDIALMIGIMQGITKLIGESSGGMLFLPLFFIFFLLPVFFSQIQTPFSKTRKCIAKYTGGGSMSWFQGTYPFFKLLLYKDGLEIRVFFNAYFIPYDHLKEVKAEKSIFGSSVIFKTELPGVPGQIQFSGLSDNKNLILMMQKISNQGSTLDNKNEEIFKSTTEPESVDKGIFTFIKKDVKYNKKILISLIIAQSVFILFAGPILIQYVRLGHLFFNQNSVLYKSKTYSPIDKRNVSEKYGLVEVKYDSYGNVVMEKYYCYDGEVISSHIKDGKPAGRSSTYFSVIFLGVFAILGMCLMALGEMIYKPLSIYGIAMFATSFIMGIVKSAIVDAII